MVSTGPGLPVTTHCWARGLSGFLQGRLPVELPGPRGVEGHDEPCAGPSV